MATATITPDKDAVVAEIFIAAPRERVFQAITDPTQVSQWWGQKGLYRITGGEADVRTGGKWVSRGIGEDGREFSVAGEYVEVDPPRLLVHTWKPDYDPSLRATLVRWELTQQSVHGLQSGGPHKMGMGTLVKIHHSGFAGNEKAASDHGEGWKRVMGWAKAFVESGETVETRK
jgi:uncharacterized protein YndB with AHSA1/START domain